MTASLDLATALNRLRPARMAIQVAPRGGNLRGRGRHDWSVPTCLSVPARSPAATGRSRLSPGVGAIATICGGGGMATRWAAALLARLANRWINGSGQESTSAARRRRTALLSVPAGCGPDGSTTTAMAGSEAAAKRRSSTALPMSCWLARSPRAWRSTISAGWRSASRLSPTSTARRTWNRSHMPRTCAADEGRTAAKGTSLTKPTSCIPQMASGNAASASAAGAEHGLCETGTPGNNSAPAELARRLFGPDQEDLPGRWVCESCSLHATRMATVGRPAAGPCTHQRERRFFVAATRPTGGGHG